MDNGIALHLIGVLLRLLYHFSAALSRDFGKISAIYFRVAHFFLFVNTFFDFSLKFYRRYAIRAPRPLAFLRGFPSVIALLCRARRIPPLLVGVAQTAVGLLPVGAVRGGRRRGFLRAYPSLVRLGFPLLFPIVR